MRNLVFEGVADAYDAARPGYPDGLYVALQDLSGVRLEGATVADVGAGTGIATRGLLDRGARVVAVDLGVNMLARLRSRVDGVALLADGNALPLRAGVADLVTYAQAWHWLDPIASIAEAVRVTRPGGAVAGWWNTMEPGRADWLAALHVRLAEACPGYRGPATPGWSMPPMAPALRTMNLAVAETWVHWTRRVEVEVFLTDLRSHSFVASLGPPRADDLITRERAELTRVFPGQRLTIPMRVYLVVGRA
jgi:SAM-dependent methyltransferase